MKIAHIITRLIIGGAQENTVLNCEDLIRQFGDEVLLLTGPPLGPEGSLMERIDKPGGVPFRIVPRLRRAIHPVNDLLAYREIRRMLKEFRPDVVHTHSAKAGILGRLAARSLGVPAIVHGVHGAPFYPYQNPVTRRFYQWCERYAAKRCDAFVSVADAMSNLMIEANIAPREKFYTVYSGMEVETFLHNAPLREEKRREFGFSDSEIVVGKIARLFHLKGHEYVIEAAQSIVEQVPQVRFFFVGDGILTEAIKSKIAEKSLEKYFVFSGLVPPKRIPAMISAMDILVHTSLREGLARVLPQALLSKKPVISYDIDGAREVVLDGVTGFLLPPKSVDALVDSVVKLAKNPELRRSMGEEGSRRCAEVFDHRYMSAKIREIYEKILTEKGAMP